MTGRVATPDGPSRRATSAWPFPRAGATRRRRSPSTGFGLDVAAGRDRRPDRPERLRQVDVPAGRGRPARARSAERSSSTANAITAPDRRIGLVFQEPRLLPWRSVAGNVDVAAGARRLAAPSGRARPPRRAARARRPRRRRPTRSPSSSRAGCASAPRSPGPRPRPGGPPARRAVQRARCPDPRAVQPGAARVCRSGPATTIVIVTHSIPEAILRRRPRGRDVAPPRPRRGGGPDRRSAAALARELLDAALVSAAAAEIRRHLELPEVAA